MRKIFVLCFLLISFLKIYNLIAMEPKEKSDENTQAENLIFQELNTLFNELNYTKMREYFYSQMNTDDTSSKLFNWIKAKADRKSDAFCSYMIVRNSYNHFYDLSRRDNECVSPATQEVEFAFKSLVISLILCFIDAYALQTLGGCEANFTTFNLYLKKYQYWWKSALKKYCPEYQRILKMVNEYFYKKDKTFRQLRPACWVTASYQTGWAGGHIHYHQIQPHLITFCKQHAEKIHEEQEAAFKIIYKNLSKIDSCSELKTDADKWEALLVLDVTKIS